MWRAASVSVYTSRRLPWNSNFQQAKKAPLNSQITTVQSKMKTAKNSNFCSTSNRGAVPIELMKTKMLDAASLHLWLRRIRPPSCSRIALIIFQVLRAVGFFVDLSAVWDESSLYFPMKSLSHVHHAVFLFLVLLQRNPEVDSVVLEHCIQRKYPNCRFECIPLVLHNESGLPMQIRHTE